MSATVAPIGWFEIAGPDPAETEAFYASVFGWTFIDARPARTTAWPTPEARSRVV